MSEEYLFNTFFDPSNPPKNETFETLRDNTPQNITQHLVGLYDAYPGGISDAYNIATGSSSGVVTATNLESCSDTTYLSDNAQKYFHCHGMRVTSYPGIKISTEVETYYTYVGAFFFSDYKDETDSGEIQLLDLWGAGGFGILYRISVYPDSKAILLRDVQNNDAKIIGYLNDSSSSVYGISFEYERAHDEFIFAVFDADGNILSDTGDMEMVYFGYNNKLSYIAVGGNSTTLILQSCVVYVNMESYYEDISVDVLHDFLFCRPCLCLKNKHLVYSATSVVGTQSYNVPLNYICNFYDIKLTNNGVIGVHRNIEGTFSFRYLLNMYLYTNNTIVNKNSPESHLLLVSSGYVAPDAFDNNTFIIFCDETTEKTDLIYEDITFEYYIYHSFIVGVSDLSASGTYFNRLKGGRFIGDIKKVIFNNKNVDYVKIQDTTVFYGVRSLTINPLGASYIKFYNIYGDYKLSNWDFFGDPSPVYCINNLKNIPCITMELNVNEVYTYMIGSPVTSGYSATADIDKEVQIKLTGDAYLSRHGLNIYN